MLIVFVVTLGISCEKEPVLNIREGMTFEPDTLIIESSGTGWELYSWQNNSGWRYSLMVGTDKINTSEAVLSNPYNVNGREQLKLLIRSLPSGEEIVWFGPEWISENMKGLTSIYEMPPLLTQYDIHSFCQKKTIKLSFVP